MTNRILKFRVWDEDDNSFRYFDLTDKNRDMFWMSKTVPNYLERIQQFTGLTDKDGKEVYEGDILKLYYPENPLIGHVIFCEHEDDPKWNVAYAKWVLVKYGKEDYLNSYHFSSKENREIIGNTFENPELLTSTK